MVSVVPPGARQNQDSRFQELMRRMGYGDRQIARVVPFDTGPFAPSLTGAGGMAGSPTPQREGALDQGIRGGMATAAAPEQQASAMSMGRGAAAQAGRTGGAERWQEARDLMAPPQPQPQRPMVDTMAEPTRAGALPQGIGQLFQGLGDLNLGEKLGGLGFDRPQAPHGLETPPIPGMRPQPPAPDTATLDRGLQGADIAAHAMAQRGPQSPPPMIQDPQQAMPEAFGPQPAPGALDQGMQGGMMAAQAAPPQPQPAPPQAPQQGAPVPPPPAMPPRDQFRAALDQGETRGPQGEPIDAPLPGMRPPMPGAQQEAPQVQAPAIAPEDMRPQMASATPQQPAAIQDGQVQQPEGGGDERGFLGMSQGMARGLLDFGLATMAAGGQPGATTLGALGQGGLSAVHGADERQRHEAEQEQAEEMLEMRRRQMEMRERSMEADLAAQQREEAQEQRTQMAREAYRQAMRHGDQETARELMPYAFPEQYWDAQADQAFQQPELEQFTLDEGDRKVTYIGDPAQPDTWERVTDAPRWQPSERAAGRGTERDRQIERLTRQLGDRERAERIADGVEVIRTDPETGLFYSVNQIDGTAQQLDYDEGQGILGAAQPEQADPTADVDPDAVEPGQADASRGSLEQISAEAQNRRATLWDVADQSPGAMRSLEELWSVTAGQVPGVGGVEETMDARTFFRIAQNDLIRSLSINPRFPVAEMERIKEETSLEPKTWDTEDALRTRMRRLDTYLRQRLENEKEAARRDSGLPRDTRAAAGQAAKDINNFLGILGVPEEGGIESRRRGVGDAVRGGAADDAPQIQSDADYEALPSGTVFIDPEGNRRRKP